MILPIYTFGAEILRQETTEFDGDLEALQAVIDDMFETMRNASGVGLASPQIGRTERMFVVDLKAAYEDDEDDDEDEPRETLTNVPGPLVFINPIVKPLDGPDVEYEEGCLSIPEIRETVVRPDSIEVKYFDRSMNPMRLTASGLFSRVIQHEFDHLNGILFVDRLSPLKRRLLKRRLRDMSRGEVSAEYPILTAVEAERRK